MWCATRWTTLYILPKYSLEIFKIRAHRDNLRNMHPTSVDNFAHSPQDIEAYIVDLLSEVVFLEVILVRLGDLLDARAADLLPIEAAHPLVADGDVAVPDKVARWENLIPSFPWIAPGWRAWGRNPRKGRDQILQRCVAEP